MALTSFRRSSAAMAPSHGVRDHAPYRAPSLMSRLLRHALFPPLRRRNRRQDPSISSLSSSSSSSSPSSSSSGQRNLLRDVHELGRDDHPLLLRSLQKLADSRLAEAQRHEEEEGEEGGEEEEGDDDEDIVSNCRPCEPISTRRSRHSTGRHRRRFSLQFNENNATFSTAAASDVEEEEEEVIRRTRSHYLTTSNMTQRRMSLSISQKLLPRQKRTPLPSRRVLRASLEQAREENDDLKRRVAQLEMAAVERKVLSTKVSELEWALDIVRDDADRIREEALAVLMVAEHEHGREREQEQDHHALQDEQDFYDPVHDGFLA